MAHYFDSDVKSSEKFIRDVMEKNFNQRVDPGLLRSAAIKLAKSLTFCRHKED